MRHKARDSGGKFALLSLLCRHIGLLFSNSADVQTRFCYVIGLKNIQIHPSTHYQIHHGFIFFPLWMADSLSNLRGCVWTEAVSETKKLRSYKSSDTCGRCLDF